MNKRLTILFTLTLTVLLGTPNAFALSPTQVAKLLASDGEPGDVFGYSVSVSGDTGVIGAFNSEDFGSNTGSAYVFRRDGSGNWTEQAKLLPTNGLNGSQFGRAVAISGNTVVIGSYNDGSVVANGGSAYVFTEDGSGNWFQQAKLVPNDLDQGDSFGWSVAVFQDTLVVGSMGDGGSGSAYVFTRDGSGSWGQQAKLVASDAAFDDFFGWSVSVDANTALVGSVSDDDNGSSSGSTYAFTRDSSGNWSQQAKLLPSDGSALENFGFSVSISGNTGLIGARNDSPGGSAYIFSRDSSGTWTEQAKLLPSDIASSDFFGNSVSLSGDTAAVGSWGDDDSGNSSGSAYVFTHDGSGNWTEEAKLLASDANAGDGFGFSVSVSADTAIIGSWADDDLGSQSGSSYVFDLSGSDSDGDGILDPSDNCVDDANADQADNDSDGIGDVCDPDDDNDTILDTTDNCIFTANSSQADSDGDGAGDACDNDLDGDGVPNTADLCPSSPDPLQTDSDGDGLGDACDPDDDNDGVADSAPDNCPLTPNADQSDLDADNIGDACDSDVDGDGVSNASDNCPVVANTDQTDTDFDSLGDACDADDDNDGFADGSDNCPLVANVGQGDADGDGQGDLCDPDDDNDGVSDLTDNCPLIQNAGQADADGDGAGDVCDPDDDNDSVADIDDNCPVVPNPSQSDGDGDGLGDVCDSDLDGDGVANAADNCPVNPNPGQIDLDGDGVGDLCDPDIDGDGLANIDDNCPSIANPGQADNEGDGLGDLCDPDDDNDTVEDLYDNCPVVANLDQSDLDGDGLGDACDPDVDGDGVANGGDVCPATPAGETVSPETGCSIAQLCPCEGPRGSTESWRNHGKYVSCTAKSASSFVEQGLISEAQKDEIVSSAGGSECGAKNK